METLNTTWLTPSYRIDMRAAQLDALNDFIDERKVGDWSQLRWRDVGKPFRVENYAQGKRLYEEQHGDEMPVQMSWTLFNRAFHSWFTKDVPAEQARLKAQLTSAFRSFRPADIAHVLEAYKQLSISRRTSANRRYARLAQIGDELDIRR